MPVVDNNAPMSGLAKLMAMKGREGDTMLAHINPMEAKLLKMYGGSGTINPSTGLPEFSGGGKDYTVQGGYKNYADDVGEVKTIEVPENWKSGPGQPITHPAFITKKEQALLKKANLHKKEDPSEIGKGKGPGGLASYDGQGDRDGGSDGNSSAGESEAMGGSPGHGSGQGPSVGQGAAAEAASEAAHSGTGLGSGVGGSWGGHAAAYDRGWDHAGGYDSGAFSAKRGGFTSQSGLQSFLSMITPFNFYSSKNTKTGRTSDKGDFGFSALGLIGGLLGGPVGGIVGGLASKALGRKDSVGVATGFDTDANSEDNDTQSEFSKSIDSGIETVESALPDFDGVKGELSDLASNIVDQTNVSYPDKDTSLGEGGGNSFMQATNRPVPSVAAPTPVSATDTSYGYQQRYGPTGTTGRTLTQQQILDAQLGKTGPLNYFTNPNATTVFAAGGGGLEQAYEQNGGNYDEFAGLVKGGIGDGMSDDVAFRVRDDGEDGPDMALLSNDEYVVDANTMSLLGNGSPDAGANILDKWREGVRKEATGSPKQAKQLDPNKQLDGLASLVKIGG